MIRHPWSDDESDPGAGPASYPWEDDGDIPGGDAPHDPLPEDSDNELEFDPESNPDHAAEAFIEELLHIYTMSAISAQMLCALCHYASKGGLRGRAKDYAKPPGAPSGHYQRHLDRQLGFDAVKAKLYELKVPAIRRAGMSREVLDIKVRNPHESLEAEYASSPTISVKLQEM